MEYADGKDAEYHESLAQQTMDQGYSPEQFPWN